MAKDDTQLVIAYFDSEDQADAAAKSLKEWDKANDDIKLGAIGVLHQDDKGKIKTKKYGQHNTGKGARIGMWLGVIAAILLGGVTLLGGVAAARLEAAFSAVSPRRAWACRTRQWIDIEDPVDKRQGRAGRSGRNLLRSTRSPPNLPASAASHKHTMPRPMRFSRSRQKLNAAPPEVVEAEPAAPVIATAAVAAAATDGTNGATEAAAATSMPAAAEAEPAAPSIVPGTVVITTVHYEGEEYVQLRNDGDARSTWLAGPCSTRWMIEVAHDLPRRHRVEARLHGQSIH